MKPRLHYFDILKGIAIFLVVMGHVLSMCVRGIDRAPILKFIGEIHMPLFFFISGWFAWSVKQGIAQSPRLMSRAGRLLIPMVVVSTLWIYAFPSTGLECPFDSTGAGLWTNEWKNGYWFTLVLFEITVLYAAIFRVFSTATSVALQIVVAAVAWCMLLGLEWALPDVVSSILSLRLTSMFFPVFIIGVFAHRYSGQFMQLCGDSRVVGLALIMIAICLSVVCWSWNYPVWIVVPSRIVLHVCLAIVGITVVRPWSERAFSPEANASTHAVAKVWEYVGRRSLAVYLLHYFFLFPLGICRPVLEGVGLAFIPLFTFAAAVASVIVAVVLAADYILSFSSQLSFLFTGTEQPKSITAK